MILSGKLIVILGDPSELSPSERSLLGNSLAFGPSIIEDSYETFATRLDELNAYQNELTDIREKIQTLKDKLRFQEGAVESLKAEISGKYEDFDYFPEDIEMRVEEISRKLPEDEKIKDFEDQITKVRNQERILKKEIKNNKIAISVFLLITLAIFASYGFPKVTFQKYPLLMSIMSLLFTFGTIILLNLHRSKVDALRDIQEEIDEQAQRFDNLILDKMKMEGRLSEILQTGEAETLSEFKEKLADYRKLKNKLEGLERSSKESQIEIADLEDSRKEIHTKIEEFLTGNDLHLHPEITHEEFIERLQAGFENYVGLIFKDLDVKEALRDKMVIERTDVDKLSVAFQISLSEAGSKKPDDSPVFFNNTFLNFDEKRLRNIIGFIIDVLPSSRGRFLLLTQSKEQYDLIAGMLNERKLDFHEREKGSSRLIFVD